VQMPVVELAHQLRSNYLLKSFKKHRYY